MDSKDRDRLAVEQAVRTWWPQSLKNKEQRIAWWREARFGCFVHWGVYALAGGRWNGKPYGGYSEHLMRRARIPLAEYIEKLVKPFNPVEFNAEAWIHTIKAAGMRYFVITAKHHDGFAMYPSDVYPYDIRMTQFKRDPMAELKEACVKHSIKFGFYYSQAWDWEHPDAPGNDWDYQNPAGDLGLYGGVTWYDEHPEILERVARGYVDKKSIPQILELIKKYEPDILWFDTPSKLPLSENIRILQAVREADDRIVVNSRLARGMGFPTFGDYINTADRPKEIYPQKGDWEAIPTTNESYGYSIDDNSHKEPGALIQLIAKSAARGGNMLMNIGPMPDGRIDPRDLAILKGIGNWFAVNGKSIYGTERTPLAVQAWGESTVKGSKLFLHVFDWPKDGKLVVGGLHSEITKAYLLVDAEQGQLSTQRLNYYDWEITVPSQPADPSDTVVVLEVDGQPRTDSSRLLSLTQTNVLRAFDADVSTGLRYGDGKQNKEYVYNWDITRQAKWRIRLPKAARCELRLKYMVDDECQGGTYRIFIASQIIEGEIPMDTHGEPAELSHEVVIPAGEHDLVIAPLTIPGQDFIRLYGVTLLPLN